MFDPVRLKSEPDLGASEAGTALSASLPLLASAGALNENPPGAAGALVGTDLSPVVVPELVGREKLKPPVADLGASIVVAGVVVDEAAGVLVEAAGGAPKLNVDFAGSVEVPA